MTYKIRHASFIGRTCCAFLYLFRYRNTSSGIIDFPVCIDSVYDFLFCLYTAFTAIDFLISLEVKYGLYFPLCDVRIMRECFVENPVPAFCNIKLTNFY